jgi:copper chaperone NosL
MNIVQRQFSAELVSQKGKVFKFDAIECMVDYLKGKDEAGFAYALVRDYNAPEDWTYARQSYFLVSKELPSPMGGFLSAYSSEGAATEMAQAKGGDIYHWEELKKLRQE